MKPEIAVLVSTFERPAHLRRVLASLAAQQAVDGAFEVVVSDDGSRDETPEVVRQFAKTARFPISFTTHDHDGFQLARCRNEGVAASTAPYLLFLDGDCLVPPDHLRLHLEHRRERTAMGGHCIYLNQQTSEQITLAEAATGEYVRRIRWSQLLPVRREYVRAVYYSLLRDPKRPKLFGGNVGIARRDYERVNGYDENFRGWGCEDDDLRLRLRAAGIRVGSIAWWTQMYHLWHPKSPSTPTTWREGPNVEYLHRPIRLTRCPIGLQKRQLVDLKISAEGRQPREEILQRVLPAWCRDSLNQQRAKAESVEIELTFAGGDGRFSRSCDCRVLIVPPGTSPQREVVRSADLIFSDDFLDRTASDRLYCLAELEMILRQRLGFQPNHRTTGDTLAHKVA